MMDYYEDDETIEPEEVSNWLFIGILSSILASGFLLWMFLAPTPKTIQYALVKNQSKISFYLNGKLVVTSDMGQDPIWTETGWIVVEYYGI